MNREYPVVEAEWKQCLVCKCPACGEEVDLSDQDGIVVSVAQNLHKQAYCRYCDSTFIAEY